MTSAATSPGAVRACDRCGCRLARDNAGERCSPCEAKELRRWLARTAGEAEAREATERREEAARSALGEGLQAVAAALDVDLEEAARTVARPGVAPAAWRVREDFVVALVRTAGLSHSAAARALGVSRWTVATWRGRLGLDTLGRPA